MEQAKSFAEDIWTERYPRRPVPSSRRSSSSSRQRRRFRKVNSSEMLDEDDDELAAALADSSNFDGWLGTTLVQNKSDG